MRQRQRWILTAIALGALLVVIFGLEFRGSPHVSLTPSPHFDSSSSPQRAVQSLYRIEVSAAANGWTALDLLTAGRLWRATGQTENAAAAYERALSLPDGDRALILRELSALYLEQGAWARAYDALRALTEVAPSTWAYFQLGLIGAPVDPAAAHADLERAADPAYADVIAALSPVLSQTPFSPLRAGVVLFEAELYPYAEHALNIAIERADDESALALAYGALARARQGKAGAAWMARALDLAPASFMVRYLEGLYLRWIGADRASLEAIIAAVALNPLEPALFAELGAAYARTGDLDRAERWLREAVALSGGDPRFTDLLRTFYETQRADLLSYFSLVTPADGAIPPAYRRNAPR